MVSEIFNTIRFINKHPIGKKSFFKSLLVYFKWQIGIRIIEKDVVHKFVGETRLLIKKGMHGATGNIYVGIHEFEHMSFLLHASNSSDLFYDIGANIGTYSVLASGVCKSKSLSFEPINDTYKLLKDNIRLNDLENNCFCFNVGVGKNMGSLKFTTGFDTMNRVTTEHDLNTDYELVDVITLDSLLREYSPTIMKIDVEGYELNVLEGAQKVLVSESLHSIIIELNEYANSNDLTRDIHEKLSSHSFIRCEYHPFSRKLVKQQGIPLKSGNAIYIKDSHFERIAERIKKAPSFFVFGHEI